MNFKGWLIDIYKANDTQEERRLQEEIKNKINYYTTERHKKA